MNKTVLIALILVVVVGGALMLMGGDTPGDSSLYGEDSTSSPVSVTPISHASVVLEWGDTVVYADPVGGASAYQNYPSPDLVVVTHTHGDHFDVDTLSGVVSEDTTLVVPETVMNQLPDQFSGQVQVMENGQSITASDLSVQAVPMYNLPESEDANHVKGDGNGYVLERDGYSVYVAGDTSGIPEMRNLSGIDMAFVPMNLPYTMDVDEAADAVLDFAPAKVYPYHYRNQDDTLSDVEMFESLVESDSQNIDAVLLDWYPDRE